MTIHPSLSRMVKAKSLLAAMTVALAFAILTLDTFIDVDIAVPVLYVAVIFLALRFCSSRGVVFAAAGCGVLTVLGYALSPGNLLGVAAIANRLLAFLAIGLVTYFGLRDRASHLALEEVWARLARSNRLTTIGGLTASIVHEVKQPIAAIITNANSGLRWLDMQPPELGEVREAIEGVTRAGYRVNEIIDGFRALARNAQLRTEPVAINELIEESIVLSRSGLEENRISVETRLANQLFPITGDRIQLQQVLLNLILNAVDAMRQTNGQRRELKLASANDSNGVLVTVCDSGKGLSQGDLAHLFNDFYTDKPGGMGMGLKISHSIVERHGGRLRATPNERSGATFHLWLPATQQAKSAVLQTRTTAH